MGRKFDVCIRHLDILWGRTRTEREGGETLRTWGLGMPRSRTASRCHWQTTRNNKQTAQRHNQFLSLEISLSLNYTFVVLLKNKKNRSRTQIPTMSISSLALAAPYTANIPHNTIFTPAICPAELLPPLIVLASLFSEPTITITSTYLPTITVTITNYHYVSPTSTSTSSSGIDDLISCPKSFDLPFNLQVWTYIHDVTEKLMDIPSQPQSSTFNQHTSNAVKCHSNTEFKRELAGWIRHGFEVLLLGVLLGWRMCQYAWWAEERGFWRRRVWIGGMGG